MGWLIRLIRALPMRKLLAGIICGFAVAFLHKALATGDDVPANATDLMKWLIAFGVGGYVGSSAYEATHSAPYDKESGGEGT